jgi:hypothetical protein
MSNTKGYASTAYEASFPLSNRGYASAAYEVSFPAEQQALCILTDACACLINEWVLPVYNMNMSAVHISRIVRQLLVIVVAVWYLYLTIHTTQLSRVCDCINYSHATIHRHQSNDIVLVLTIRRVITYIISRHNTLHQITVALPGINPKIDIDSQST